MNRWVLGAIIAFGIAAGTIAMSYPVLAGVYGTPQRDVYVQLENQLEKVVPQTIEEVEQSGSDVLYCENVGEIGGLAAGQVAWSDASWYQHAQVGSLQAAQQVTNNGFLNSQDPQMSQLQVSKYENVGKYLLTVRRRQSQSQSGNVLVAPTLISPAENEVLRDNTPTFVWNTQTAADNYKISVTTNGDFASALEENNTSFNYYTQTKALPDNIYYWQVAAYDNSGNSRSSQITYFAISQSDSEPSFAPGIAGAPFEDTTYWSETTIENNGSESVSFLVYETKAPDILPIASSIGIAAGVIVFAVWIGYRQAWGDATSTLLEQGLHDMTVRDIEIVGYIMQQGEFTIPELMKLTNASKITVWRTVQKLVGEGLVAQTEQTKPAANGLGGRGKPSQIYKYVGGKSRQKIRTSPEASSEPKQVP